MENTDFSVSPSAPESQNNNGKTPNRRLFKIVIGLFFVGVLAALGIYFLLLPSMTEEAPPSLSLGTGGLQGFIGTGKYIEFTQTDINRAEDFDDTVDRNSGVQFYYTEKLMTYKEIIESISPKDTKLKCLFAYYDSTEDNFFTYPEGPYTGTELIKSSDLDSDKLPENQGFLLVCSDSYKTEKGDVHGGDEKPEAVSYSLDDMENGWNLASASSDAELKGLVDDCSNRVSSVWVQNEESDFVKTDKSDPSLEDGYYMVWFKLSGDSVTCEGGSAYVTADDITQCLADNNMDKDDWMADSCFTDLPSAEKSPTAAIYEVCAATNATDDVILRCMDVAFGAAYGPVADITQCLADEGMVKVDFVANCFDVVSVADKTAAVAAYDVCADESDTDDELLECMDAALGGGTSGGGDLAAIVADAQDAVDFINAILIEAQASSDLAELSNTTAQSAAAAALLDAERADGYKLESSTIASLLTTSVLNATVIAPAPTPLTFETVKEATTVTDKEALKQLIIDLAASVRAESDKATLAAEYALLNSNKAKASLDIIEAELVKADDALVLAKAATTVSAAQSAAEMAVNAYHKSFVESGNIGYFALLAKNASVDAVIAAENARSFADDAEEAFNSLEDSQASGQIFFNFVPIAPTLVAIAPVLTTVSSDTTVAGPNGLGVFYPSAAEEITFTSNLSSPAAIKYRIFALDDMAGITDAFGSSAVNVAKYIGEKNIASAGDFTISWDGKDKNGRTVDLGNYLILMKATSGLLVSNTAGLSFNVGGCSAANEGYKSSNGLYTCEAGNWKAETVAICDEGEITSSGTKLCQANQLINCSSVLQDDYKNYFDGYAGKICALSGQWKSCSDASVSDPNFIKIFADDGTCSWKPINTAKCIGSPYEGLPKRDDPDRICVNLNVNSPSKNYDFVGSNSTNNFLAENYGVLYDPDGRTTSLALTDDSGKFKQYDSSTSITGKWLICNEANLWKKAMQSVFKSGEGIIIDSADSYDNTTYECKYNPSYSTYKWQKL